MSRDFFLPYRHFVHWNVSKAAIFLSVLATGTLASLPFGLAILAVVWYVRSYPSGEATRSVLSGTADSLGVFQVAALENFWPLTLATLFLIGIVTVYSFFFAYGYYLLANSYRSYLGGGELPIRSIGYFDRRRIGKFLAVAAWTSLFVGIPAVVGLVAFLGLVLFVAYSGYAESAGANDVVGALVAFVLGTSGAATLFVAFRTGFSGFFLLSDDRPGVPAREYVSKSVAATKSKFWKVAFRLLPFAFVLAFVTGLLSGVESSWKESRVYESAVLARSEAGGAYADDAAFLKERLSDYLEPGDLRDVVDVFASHEGVKTGIDREFFRTVAPYLDLSEFDPNGAAYETAFNVVSFLLLEGAFLMVLLSAHARFVAPEGASSADAPNAPAATPKRQRVPKAAEANASSGKASGGNGAKVPAARRPAASKAEKTPAKSPGAKTAVRKSPGASKTEKK